MSLVKAALQAVNRLVVVDQASEEGPAQYDPQSNGAAESGAKLAKQQVKVVKGCLERRPGVRPPPTHTHTHTRILLWRIWSSMRLFYAPIVSRTIREARRTRSGGEARSRLSSLGLVNDAFGNCVHKNRWVVARKLVVGTKVCS